jgi:hypothetical protein
MDPYIESSGMWGDFHLGLIAAARAELNARLPPGYAASSELYVWFHEPGAEDRVRLVEPDVYVKQTTGAARARGKARGRTASATVPPARIVLPGVQRRKHRFVEVRDTRSNRVVTVVEILSPDNKSAGDGREAYLAKRNESLANRLNLVEFDLLRGGRRLPLGEPPPRMSDYYAMVCRAWEWPRADFWTFSLRDRLPQVPIPLGPEMPDVFLDLRACVDRAYEEGRYGAQLPYGGPLTPRPTTADEQWVEHLLSPGPRRGRGRT